MKIFDRYEQVLEMYHSGSNITDISKKFNMSRASASDLVQKAKMHRSLCEDHPFYLAIIQAVQELGVDERLAKRCFNVFNFYNVSHGYRYDLPFTISLEDIESHKVNINDYSDDQLLQLRQLGRNGLRILRTAQYIYDEEKIPSFLLDTDTPKNYITGADICRLIRKHNLQDKIFYNALDGQFDELWFYMDKPTYKLGILHILTGELEELEELKD